MARRPVAVPCGTPVVGRWWCRWHIGKGTVAMDSTSVFAAALADLELSELAPKFKENRWDTSADFVSGKM